MVAAAELHVTIAESLEGVLSGSVPSLFRAALRDNGREYTLLVFEALEREEITLANVSDYLGVRLKHLDKIADAAERAATVG